MKFYDEILRNALLMSIMDIVNREATKRASNLNVNYYRTLIIKCRFKINFRLTQI